MPPLIYYNPNVAIRDGHGLPGIERFSNYFKIYNPTVMPIDRSGTIKVPIRVRSLFPIPTLRPFTKDLESICNDRARELLSFARTHSRSLYVFWSGGIDSTLLLVSLIKNATKEDKERIVVLMSEESIAENPNFFREHIRGKLRYDSATLFPYLLDGEHFVVGGEHNDQVFGSDMVASLINRFGEESIHAPYNHDTFKILFGGKLEDPAAIDFFLDIFERVTHAAPVEIRTNFDFLWWINFSMKWQSVFTRMLAYASARTVSKITPEYIGSMYTHFYNTEEFQLWSMSNMDRKIKDTWASYKWPCKDIIYDYTKDAEYRDTKTKRGSLHFLIIQQIPFSYIDERTKFYSELEPAAFYEADNDFV